MAQINPELLLSDEVSFEIRCRGGEPVKTAEERRSQLRGLIRSKKEPVYPNVDMVQEVELCSEKLSELTNRIEELGEPILATRKGVPQIRARLDHLQRRLRILVTRDEENKFGVECLLKEVVEALTEFQNKMDAGSSNVTPPPVKAIAEAPAIESDLVSPTNPGLIQYNKLPNPLSQMIAGLTVVDGLDPTKLLQFIEQLLRFGEFPGVTDYELLQLVFPVCRSPLVEILTKSIARKGSVDDLHRDLLEAFIPSRMRERLVQQRVYRLQKIDETLASFAADIKMVARVLRVSLTEKQIVSIIIDGITSNERSRLVFHQRPNTWEDLSALCIAARAVEYSDSLRPNLERNRSATPPTPVRIIEHDRRVREVTCWNCGRQGHVARECRRNKNERRENHYRVSYPADKTLKNPERGGDRQ